MPTGKSSSHHMLIRKQPLVARLFICSLVASLVALFVYSLTLAGFMSPDVSETVGATSLFTQWLGLDALNIPLHPLWGSLVKSVSGLNFSTHVVMRLNLISLVCGVLSAGMLCYLVGSFVYALVEHEETVPFARDGALIAGLISSVTFIFATAVWQSSTHLEYRIFDVFWALLFFIPALLMNRWPHLSLLWAAVMGIGVGMGAVESVLFVPLAILYLYVLIKMALRVNASPYSTPLLFLLVASLTGIFYARSVYADFLSLDVVKLSGSAKSIGDVFTRVMNGYGSTRGVKFEILDWLFGSGSLVTYLVALFTFISSTLIASRGLNNERKWGQYTFHAALTVMCILAIATPLAPESLRRSAGVLPVATTTLICAVCGYLAAYWYVLARAALPIKEFDELPREVTFGRTIAPWMLLAFLAFVLLSALVNGFRVADTSGAYADVCAHAILDRMGTRTWLVTDGSLDDHLRLAARARGQELNLVCLQRDSDKAYLKQLTHLITEKNLNASLDPSKGVANLALSVRQGVVPFLEDWFKSDPKITQKVAVYGAPELWYKAECYPISEGLFFGGLRDMKSEFDANRALADSQALWKKVEPLVRLERRVGSRAIPRMRDRVSRARMKMRRHIGFVMNNLGVTLQDVGRNADAVKVYERVLGAVDRDNICALFNLYEMARSGQSEAVARKADIERRVNLVVRAVKEDPNLRYNVWSLSHYYGFIRVPSLFLRLGIAWARSAQMGAAAVQQVTRAMDMMSGDQQKLSLQDQSQLYNLMGSIYARGDEDEKSKTWYEKTLQLKGANHHDAHTGLARLALQRGDVTEARDHLLSASSISTNEMSLIDRAIVNLIDGDLKGAGETLQKAGEMNEQSLMPRAMLANVLFQQYDRAKSSEVRARILQELELLHQRMTLITPNQRDFSVLMVRGKICLRKGRKFLKEARDTFALAFSVQPSARGVGELLLQADVSLGDATAAQVHANRILRLDRENRTANWVMGSLALAKGDAQEAEMYLLRAVETGLSSRQGPPLPMALNDLADLLAKSKRPAESEYYARQATQTAPLLYVAWETLATALLDQNKNLDEAEKCVKESIRLSKEETGVEDMRLWLTLLRVQIVKKDVQEANVTLRLLRSHQKELRSDEQRRLKTYETQMRQLK